MILLRLSALSLLVLILCGCAEKKVIPELVSPRESLMQQAAVYWDREDYAQSQELYQRLSRMPELSSRQQIIVEQRLGISAYYSHDHQTALTALDRWRQLDPPAARFWQWHEMYSSSLKHVEGEEAFHRYLSELVRDMDLDFKIREKAALTLAEFHFHRSRYPEAMSVLERIHALAATEEEQISLEESLGEFLEQFPAARLEKAIPFLDREKLNLYPLNVFFWSLYSIQLEDDPSLWEALWPKLSQLSRQGEFVDRARYLQELEDWLDKLGTPAAEIVLLLPLSGQFSSTGWKILRGAGIAHWESILNGSRVRVRVLNTDEQGWLETFQEMDSISIVGGPLSRDAWQQIVSSGLNRKKPFFTFLPSIEDEGISGWRFFTSPRDQVRSLIDKAVSDLGFTDFAIFYPEDDFGRTFAQIFWEEASSKGVRISGLQSYPGNEPQRWNSIVSSFLGVKSTDRPYLNPNPDFQAVFIPDSLSRVKGLIPQFFYFDQNQLVFMGPMLWSQAFSPDTLEQQYFSLSMTTGAWLAEHQTPGSSRLKSLMKDTLQGDPDLWVALGYDFVKFAAGLGTLPPADEHDQVNELLSANRHMEWSMAPVYWCEQGRAYQNLHVFQMNRAGLSLADPEYISSLVLIREARKAHWMERLREKEEAEPERRAEQE